MVSHSHYDDYKFEPKFEITQEDLDEISDVDRICSDSQSCVYDYVVTHDSGYGEQTKKSEAMAQNMHQDISEKVSNQKIVTNVTFLSIRWSDAQHYPNQWMVVSQKIVTGQVLLSGLLVMRAIDL